MLCHPILSVPLTVQPMAVTSAPAPAPWMISGRGEYLRHMCQPRWDNGRATADDSSSSSSSLVVDRARLQHPERADGRMESKYGQMWERRDLGNGAEWPLTAWCGRR
jgi:hypothetical protein